MKRLVASWLVIASGCAVEGRLDDSEGVTGRYAVADTSGAMSEPGELDARSDQQVSEHAAEVPDGIVDATETVLQPGRDASKLTVGKDTRVPVANTTIAPYASIVAIYAEFEGRTEFCTGSMIGPSAVLTAAHCVYDLRSHTYARSTRVVPGSYPDKNGEPAAPFGSTYGIQGSVPDAYKQAAVEWEAYPSDFAVIRLKANIGSTVGTRKLAVMPGKLEGRKVVLTAYQGDLYEIGERTGLKARIMTESTDMVRKSYDGIFNHYADSYPGSSGGPLVSDGSLVNTIFAIHIAGKELDTGNRFNIGVPLDQEKIALIRSWATR